MKCALIVVAVLTVYFATGSAQAGIFGHRRSQSAGNYYYSQPQPTYVQPPARYVQPPPTVYRSYSQQPRSNPFPFDSRADPRDWKEAHRGYGVKIRGW